MAFWHQAPEYDGFTCFWRIKHFDLTGTSSNCWYVSPVFKVPMLHSSSWHLALQHVRCDSLGLYLYKEAENRESSKIDIQLSIFTSSGWRIRYSDFFKFKPGGAGRGTPLLLDWNRRFSRNKHVVNGCLMVSCHMSNGATLGKHEQCFIASEVDFSGELWHSPILQFCDLEPKDLAHFPISTFSVSEECTSFVQMIQNLGGFKNCKKERRQEMEEIKQQETTKTKGTETENSEEKTITQPFKDKKFQYVTIHTPSKDFFVPKVLICAKSPVFNAMFLGNRKENDNTVNIDDVACDTLSLLLQFLHLKSVSFDDLEWDAVVKLYYAADKYQIEHLKKACAFYLKKNATDENVCDAIILDYLDQEPQQTVQENIIEKTEVTSYGNWCF